MIGGSNALGYPYTQGEEPGGYARGDGQSEAKDLAQARYDTSERLAKSERLMKAGMDLRAGLRRPERVGIPGIGLPPATAKRVE